MKNFTIISVFFLLLFITNMQAQELAPLNLGNIWIYEHPTTIGRMTIVDTNIVINAVPYFEFSIESNYGGETDSHYVRLREDGFYVHLNKFDSTESIYYKKNAVIGDTWTVGTLEYSIEDTFIANVFGEQTTIKFLLADDGLIYRQEYWTEKFGKLSSQDFGGMLDNLLGCVIDGTAYGDTTFTIVSVENEFETPNSFYLAQNYPNPFNPITNIEYVLPEESFINLTVYNSLGEEILVLVDEYQKSGKHIVQFSTNDIKNLSSGVYFYTLKANNNITTKKMVLLY